MPGPENILELTFEEWYEKYHMRYENMAGVRRHLSNKYGRGEWGEDEFVQYMKELYKERREKVELELRAEKSTKPAPTFTPDAGIQERVAAYLEYYENPAPNDRVMIEAMAALEVAIQQMQHQFMSEMQSDSPSRTVAKSWSDQLRHLMGEHRRIQDSLGISRSDREKEERGADQQEYVQDVIRRSAAFVKEHAIQIRCPYCAEEEAEVEINMGFILFHFRDNIPWQFGYECPRCGRSVSLTAAQNGRSSS